MSFLIPLAINAGLSAVSIATPLLFPSTNQTPKTTTNPNTNAQDPSFLSKSFSFNLGNSKVTLSTGIIIAIIAFVLLLVVL